MLIRGTTHTQPPNTNKKEYVLNLNVFDDDRVHGHGQRHHTIYMDLIGLNISFFFSMN